MKKVVSILLMLTLVLGALAGCGGSKPAENQPAASQPAASQPAESKPAAKTIELTMAMHTNPGTIADEASIRFKKAVEEKTKGQIVVKLFPGSQLGSETDNLQQIKIGEIQGSIFGDLLTSQLAPDLDASVIPYIYPNIDEVYKMWNGPLGDRIKEALVQKGNAVLIGLQTRGARNLTANKKIQKPEDLKGLKIRVPEIPTWVAVWKGFGALPTPIAFAETYSALQTKVVDAQENPFENIFTSKFYEVQKYTIKTEHLFNLYHWVLGKKFLDSLSPENQKIVTDELVAAIKWGDEEARKAEAELEKKCKDAGMEIVEVDTQLFRKAALPAIQELSKSWQPGVWDEVKQYLE